MISLPLRNQQLPEKSDRREDGVLDVVDLFPTIQGEGPFVGEPAVFIRLAGCNLQCPLCDTDYTLHRDLVSVDDLMEKAEKCIWPTARIRRRYKPLLVITGGEPFRQNCGRLIAKAARIGWRVQVETNGTLLDESMIAVWRSCTIICSPKTPTLNPTLEQHIFAYKYVLRAGEVEESDGLPTSVLGNGLRPARRKLLSSCPVYVQPADEGDEAKNKANREAAIESCFKFGYILCLQTHKLLGLP